MHLHEELCSDLLGQLTLSRSSLSNTVPLQFGGISKTNMANLLILNIWESMQNFRTYARIKRLPWRIISTSSMFFCKRSTTRDQQKSLNLEGQPSIFTFYTLWEEIVGLGQWQKVKVFVPRLQQNSWMKFVFSRWEVHPVYLRGPNSQQAHLSHKRWKRKFQGSTVVVILTITTSLEILANGGAMAEAAKIILTTLQIIIRTMEGNLRTIPIHIVLFISVLDMISFNAEKCRRIRKEGEMMATVMLETVAAYLDRLDQSLIIWASLNLLILIPWIP